MGKVYILTNDAMPDIIKIGITDSTVEERIKSLDNTSLPLPFRFYYAIECDRYKEIEKQMQIAFGDLRVRKNREFFSMDPEKAVAALKIAGGTEIKIGNEMIDDEGSIVNDDDTKQEKTCSQRFSFKSVNIPLNEELTFTRDENKICKVISNSEVEYKNENYSLSKLADKLLRELGYDWKAVQGPAFFQYKGKILSKLKKEIDEKEADEDAEKEL